MSLHYLVKLSICIFQVNSSWSCETKTHQNVFVISFIKWGRLRSHYYTVPLLLCTSWVMLMNWHCLDNRYYVQSLFTLVMNVIVCCLDIEANVRDESCSKVDVSYFRNLIRTESDRLTLLCTMWRNTMDNSSDLSDDGNMPLIVSFKIAVTAVACQLCFSLFQGYIPCDSCKLRL